jgi:hypothetical protein
MERVSGTKPAEFADKSGMASQFKIGGDSLFECNKPKRFEWAGGIFCEGLVGEIGERFSAPQSQSFAQDSRALIRRGCFCRAHEHLEKG